MLKLSHPRRFSGPTLNNHIPSYSELPCRLRRIINIDIIYPSLGACHSADRGMGEGKFKLKFLPFLINLIGDFKGKGGVTRDSIFGDSFDDDHVGAGLFGG